MSEWISINGCNAKKTAKINICGGCAEWWNYVLVFEDDYYMLYVEDRTGLTKKSGKLIYHIDKEEVKEIYDLEDYEVQDDEMIIDEDFFCW